MYPNQESNSHDEIKQLIYKGFSKPTIEEFNTYR